MNNDEQLRECLSAVLKIDPKEIGNLTTSANIEEWDSLNHLNLILSLEDRFGVSFTEDEAVDLFSYADIKRNLAKHGVDFS